MLVIVVTAIKHAKFVCLFHVSQFISVLRHSNVNCYRPKLTSGHRRTSYLFRLLVHTCFLWILVSSTALCSNYVPCGGYVALGVYMKEYDDDDDNYVDVDVVVVVVVEHDDNN